MPLASLALSGYAASLCCLSMYGVWMIHDDALNYMHVTY